ncbi:hypothetical protein D3C72_2414610 [compost metagenome]
MIDQAAQPDPEGGGEDQIDARDHARGEDGPCFDEDPEGQGEPDGEIGDVGHQIIGQDLVERLDHRVTLGVR